MTYKILTDISTEPVTLEEAKAHLVVDFSEDDALLTGKIKAAREWLEQYTGLAFAQKTIKVQYDSTDDNYLLPIGPVIGDITTVQRIVNGETTTLTSSDYWFTGFEFPTLQFERVWTSYGSCRTAYAVTYNAGFNTDNPLPQVLKEAICKLTAELYRDRENSISGTINTMLPHNVRALVSLYRRQVWF